MTATDCKQGITVPGKKDKVTSSVGKPGKERSPLRGRMITPVTPLRHLSCRLPSDALRLPVYLTWFRRHSDGFLATSSGMVVSCR